MPGDRRVVLAKVGVPTARADAVPRPRLLDLLDDDAFRTVLVSAPAGFGKTVLILDWLRRSGRAAAWVSLDALDDDVERFSVHLGAALRRLPGASLDPAAELVERASGAGADALAARLPALLAGGDEDAVLVLDDVHHLEDAGLLALLDGLVHRPVGGPRVVLVTRVDPPIPLGRIRLAGELLEIRQRDLRFTVEEAGELLGRLLPGELGPELVARLEARTEGWAAGLQMAALAVRHAEDPATAVEAFSGSHELMVDYLVEEILARQDEALQRFLLDTSVLPRFTAEACVHVTGDPEAARHLQAVDEAHLFLVSLDARQTWYRYHHLFAELLTFRLRRLAPEREDGLRERASRWFEDQGDVQEALAQAAAVDSPARLVELLDRHGYPILARSQFAGFARWLAAVPDPLSRRLPMFLVAVAWYRMQTERAPDLETVFTALDAALEDPPPGYAPARLREARMHRDALRAFSLRMADRLEEALSLNREALDRLPAGAGAIRGVLEFNLGAIHLRLADMEPAREWLERAYESCLGTGADYLVLASLGHLGSVAAHTEGLEPARQRLESAVAFAEEEGLGDVPASAIILYQLAQVHWLADEPERARPWLERALDVTRDERETDIRANVLIHKARIDLAADRVDDAEEALTAATALAHAHNVKPFATSLDVERARVAEARSGRVPPLPGAREPGEASPGGDEPSGTWDRAGWTSVREAETAYRLHGALAHGEREKAAELAALLRRAAEAGGRGPALCAARVGEAAVAGEATARHQALAAAVELAAVRGYVRPLLETGGVARSLFEAAVAGGSLSKAAREHLVRRVLPRLPDGPRPAAVGPASVESDLTEREMEVLGLLATGSTNKAIARRMFLSTNTVKTHLKRVYAKLDVSNRTQAVERARVLGLLGPARGHPPIHPEDHPNG
ncbi:MAG: LuxR C-terminal-related transcriptional regulator [Gemmatimonadota bacterium]